MACVNGMTTAEICAKWSDEVVCESTMPARRFPSHVTAMDISEQALAYGKRTGIFDASVCADLNSRAGLDEAKPPMRNAQLLISTAALVYLEAEVVGEIMKAFAEGEGEGYAIA